MPPFKDEHILIISPGSSTTLAQLGLPESFSPASFRIPTRMFPAERDGEWEPVKIRLATRQATEGAANELAQQDTAMLNTDAPVDQSIVDPSEEEELKYEEDSSSDEGAVYPIVEGKVVNWPCLLALLTHIYNTLSPIIHTPIIVVSQPCWTPHDREILTQFFFEKFQTPAFCLMDAALAVSYAFATSNATVVDVGYAKCDITTISDHVVHDLGRISSIPHCGGEAMTQQLLSLLGSKGFSRDMCEQLKKSNICEILAPGIELPTQKATATPSVPQTDPNGVSGTMQDSPVTILNAQQVLSPSKVNGVERVDGDDDGVLDVAAIVASGKTTEFLAKKEKEKNEKAAAKKAAANESATAKIARLPNSQKFTASFNYTGPSLGGKSSRKDGAIRQIHSDTLNTPTEREDDEAGETDTKLSDTLRQEVEVGIERLQAATGGILERIADSIYRCILAVPEVRKRSELWESLVIVGDGSKIKGFKEALLMILTAKYLISPNSATIFTSELPSTFSTPAATGTHTPTAQTHGFTQPPSGVNPLLHAATTASLNASGSASNVVHYSSQQVQSQPQTPHAFSTQFSHQHSSHAQTPTSIKVLKTPEYFPEWKECGMEEASFLGAQVAARVVFVVDQGVSKGFMTRTEYNEMGPSGIHEVSL